MKFIKFYENSRMCDGSSQHIENSKYCIYILKKSTWAKAI